MSVSGMSMCMSDQGIVEPMPKNRYIIPQGIVGNIINNITNMSAYAYGYQLDGGYLTLNGGHRVGICGKISYTKDGKAVYKNITSINIRICKNKMLFDDVVFGRLYHNVIYNTCVISPPSCGKTTFLKNYIMHLNRYRPDVHICVADERGEMWQNNGDNVSVISNCTKDKAAEVFVRCMSPGVVVFDELWSDSDFYAVANVISAGIPALFSIHGTSYKNAMNNIRFKKLSQYIQCCVQLSNRKGNGTVEYAGGVEKWNIQL